MDASPNLHFGIPVNQGNQITANNSVNVNNMQSPLGSVSSPQPLPQQATFQQFPQQGGAVNKQQHLQQKQKMMLQQRAMQQKKQQQVLQNYELQFNQLLSTLNKKPKRLYNFVEDVDSILRKYEQYRPSFEFHIYENNYKICAPANTRIQQQQKTPELSTDGLILNKNNETLKEFLEFVARGRIPESIMEVLRDSNIQFYEGNLILQVYDHTNTVDIISKDKQSKNSPSTNLTTESTNASSASINVNTTHFEGNAKTPISTAGTPAGTPVDSTNQQQMKSATQSSPNFQQLKPKQTASATTLKKPRVYRTLLRPNDLTFYYDMMSYADHSRFSDNIYQQLEAEVLSLTKRNISLDVQLDPYTYKDILDEESFIQPNRDPENDKLVYNHRVISDKLDTKGAIGHIEQHEELPQHSSNYEQMMLIMDERTTTSTNSTLAFSLTKKALQASSNNKSLSGRAQSSPDEDYADSKLNSSNGTNSNNNTGSKVAMAAAAAIAAVGSNGRNESNQFNRIKFIEQWRLNKEKRSQNIMNSNTVPNAFNQRISMTTSNTSQQQSIQQQKSTQTTQPKGKNVNKRAANTANDKPKPKKPRKNTKKPDGEQTAPKKKRSPKKKQAETKTT